MNHDAWLIVSSVLGVFLVMALGAFCRHRGWLTREADQSLASLTANVLLPCLFLDRILEGEQFDSLAHTWTPPLLGFLITTAGFLLAWSTARLLGSRIGLETDAKQRAFGLCAGICNYGYIPLPLAAIFYPAAEVDLILHNVGVEIALWSVGIAVITGGAAAAADPRRSWRKVVLNPPLVAVVVAVTLRQLELAERLPGAVLKSIGWLSDCAIPMGLLLSGAIIIDYFRHADWRGAGRTVVAAIGFRQLLMPVVMLSVAGWVAQTQNLKQVLMLEAAMPAAVFPIVIVRLFERDTATALRVVLSTSLAGIVLIPTWLAVGSWWLGL